MNKFNTTFFWVLRIVSSLILLQTLYFKFTAQAESVELFSKLGVEPWGRIGTGCIELVASILLLIPKSTFIGAALTIGLMLGAVFSHFLVIGIASNNDGGLLFGLAVFELILASCILYIERDKLSNYKNNFQKK